jgi:hypothetical protein
MLYCKNNNLIFKLVLLCVSTCLFLISYAFADVQSNLLIQQAEIANSQEVYYLYPQAELKLSDEVKQTLDKGFKLNFILEFQLSLPRKYWFSDEIVTVTQPITLIYHPLSRRYLLTQGRYEKSLANLKEVAAEFLQLRPIKVFSENQIEHDQPYEAALLIRLDYRKLPSAIKYNQEESSAWDLTSQRFEWKPNLIK